MCRDLDVGDDVATVLDKCPWWATYKDQKHDLFIGNNQTAGYLMGPTAAVAGYLTVRVPPRACPVPLPRPPPCPPSLSPPLQHTHPALLRHIKASAITPAATARPSCRPIPVAPCAPSVRGACPKAAILRQPPNTWLRVSPVLQENACAPFSHRSTQQRRLCAVPRPPPPTTPAPLRRRRLTWTRRRSQCARGHVPETRTHDEKREEGDPATSARCCVSRPASSPWPLA